MNQKLHILLTGEEIRPRFYSVFKARVKTVVCGSLVLLVSFIAGLKGVTLQHNVTSLEKELQSLSLSNNSLQEQIARLDEEKSALLEEVNDKSNKISRLMEAMLSTIGTDVKVEESIQNTGGPFTQLPSTKPDDLVFLADQFLDMIQYIPLGAPVSGVITSKFGRRIDPINSKPAFHNGIDIKGKMGSDVKATADGIVFEAGDNRGDGRFVTLEHNNGFRTTFCHFKKILVKKGERVDRGQTIGLLGNSGRSTGPHVHYEITYENTPVNPLRYMKKIDLKALEFAKL